jgi:biotin-(acetyl-CoA carboxylase) ligase
VWHAQALGISEDGALRVCNAAGEIRHVHAADVSVRAAKVAG